jgi:peroxiredoxin family protein
MTNRMSIVLFSGTVDKIMAASVLSSGAVAMNMDVDIFATFYGLNALRKEVVGTNTRFSKDFEEMSGPLVQMMQQKHMPTWYETLTKAKAAGNVKIHACSLVADMMDLKKEDFDPIVDDMCGVGTYVDIAKDSQITLFI